jgi:predicted permease
MVLAQISTTAMLLVLAGHLGLQAAQAGNADHHYPAREVLTANVGLFDNLFPEMADRSHFYQELERRLGELPGVFAAGLGTSLPGMETGLSSVSLQGEVYVEAQEVPRARLAFVSPGFFQVFQLSALQGRILDGTDGPETPPVALITRSFAERYFPDGDALGKQIRRGGPDSEAPWRAVVGVIPDLDMDGAFNPAGNPQGVLLPLAQTDPRFVSLALRTGGDPLALAPAVRDEVIHLQGDTPVYFVRTLHDAINTNLLDVLLLGGLLWSLAVAAFVLAAVGLYGVTSFAAGQRTRELGVRIALGAKGGDVLRLVVRQGTTQVVVGLTTGVLIAGAIMRLMASQQAEMIPWHSGVTLAVCCVLGATGLAAVFTPARRATKVDPVEALRAE